MAPAQCDGSERGAVVSCRPRQALALDEPPIVSASERTGVESKKVHVVVSHVGDVAPGPAIGTDQR